MVQQKKVNQKNKPIGKPIEEKKHLIDPRYKNTFWTIFTLVVLTLFFIINNTKTEPERGAYPPNYNPTVSSMANSFVDPRVNLITTNSDSIK